MFGPVAAAPSLLRLQIPDRRFGGYIFDCDGTLADTMPLHYRAWQRIIGEYGGVFTEQAFYALGGKPTGLIFAQLRDEQGLHIPDVDAAAQCKERYFFEFLHEVAPIEPVLDIARRMYTRAPLAVASGGVRESVELILNTLGIRHLFDAVVCLEDYARPKPHPDPFLEAARRINVPPGDCVVFEDAELGVQAAAAAGMQCVFVPSRRTPP